MRRDARTLPIIVWWDKNFYPEETDGKNTWRWSKKESSLTIINNNNKGKNITLEFSVISDYPEYSNLYISSKSFNKNLKIKSTSTNLKEKIMIPEGKYQINFKTDSKKVLLSNSTRELYFRIFNLKIK